MSDTSETRHTISRGVSYSVSCSLPYRETRGDNLSDAVVKRAMRLDMHRRILAMIEADLADDGFTEGSGI